MAQPLCFYSKGQEAGNPAVTGWFCNDFCTYLDTGNSPITFNVSIVTKWGGQAGASYILASTGYNGWAARDTPIVIYSTGGDFAVCYHPIYILGFLPLALTALFVIAWSTILFATSAFAGSTHPCGCAFLDLAAVM
jgi:hypothetical protein